MAAGSRNSKLLPAKGATVSSLRHGNQGVGYRGSNVGAHDDGNSHLDLQNWQRRRRVLSVPLPPPAFIIVTHIHRIILTSRGNHADNYGGGRGWTLDQQSHQDTNDKTSQRVGQNRVILKDVACGFSCTGETDTSDCFVSFFFYSNVAPTQASVAILGFQGCKRIMHVSGALKNKPGRAVLNLFTSNKLKSWAEDVKGADEHVKECKQCNSFRHRHQNSQHFPFGV